MNSAIELIANVQSIRLELMSLPSVLRSLARSGNACTGAFVLMTKASLSLDSDFLVGSGGPSCVPPRCVICDDHEPIVLGEQRVRVVGAPRSEPQCLIGAPLGRRPGAGRDQGAPGPSLSRMTSGGAGPTEGGTTTGASAEQSFPVQLDLLERDAELRRWLA